MQVLSYRPHRRFNVIFGDNGQGKTNLIEAIFLLATQRSFRTARIDELVRFGTNQAEIVADISHADVERRLSLQILTKPNRKQAFVDGKTVRQTDYFDGVHVVLFAPDDLHLPKDAPESRRRFLDRAIWNTNSAYLDEVREYQQVLKNRNAVLRSQNFSVENRENRTQVGPSEDVFGNRPEALLAVYTEQLACLGARLVKRRSEYLSAIASQLQASFENISRSGHFAELVYKPKLSAKKAQIQQATVDELTKLLLTQLDHDKSKDEQRGFTHSGPHGDDIVFMLDGREAASHASQGQIRAVLLALKITEIQHLLTVRGTPPILLLDDVSSELDERRNSHLFDFLRSMPSQVFITTTSPKFVQLEHERQDVCIQNGKFLDG